MKLKFEITDELVHKFNILMQNELGLPIRKVNIEDLGSQYQFRFCDNKDGGSWHFELEKNSFEGGTHHILRCSTIKMNIPIDYIKDLKMFCSKIAELQRMQIEYVNRR